MVRIAPSGAVRLRLQKVVAGRLTSLGQTVLVSGLRVRDGTWYRLRFSAVGAGPTTLRAKVWRATNAQPSGWQIRRSDSASRLQKAGGVGIRVGAGSRVGNLPVAFTIDNLVAKRAATSSGGSGGSGGSSDYLLMPRSELMALPTSGSAWTALKSIADGSLGTADLCDQNNKHNVRTLAVALVYARTGTSSYYTKARNAIMSAIGTERVGCYNAILSLGRQLGAYVLAADLIKLAGSDDSTFRSWLSSIRTRELGGHGRWKALTATHNDSTNNWGAFAGASRIAASLYLGDTTDVANAAKVVRGFLGDRSAYAGFRKPQSPELEWACSSDPSVFTPVNRSCTRSGINLDGVIPHDAMRDDNGLRWPMGSKGNAYTQETLQALMVQVELLYRSGYSGAWGWSSSALRRAADVVTRNARAGGPGWNQHSVHQHIPWLLNKRYGLSLPTKSAAFGRVFGYTDWLYSR
jgi:hypothetical protein